MDVRSLSCHATYRCQKSGACCTSGWPIAVEPECADRLRVAARQGEVARAFDVDPIVTPDDGHGAHTEVLALVDGRCVFYQTEDGRCSVHHRLGHDALPLACRQFPRVVVSDPRGVSVTLSHYCPTAAALLERDDVVQIVRSPAAFPPGGEYVGLDARASLPPLLRPRVLMDWESWWEFERQAVDLVANGSDPPARALARLSAVVEDVRTWCPDDDALIERVRDAFDRATSRDDALDFDALRREVIGVISTRAAIGQPRRAPGTMPVTDAVAKRFLATHAFANWTAHLGQGLRTWLRSLQSVYAWMASGATLREVDLVFRHFVDPHALAVTLSRVEQDVGAAPLRRHRRRGDPSIRY
jgi:Fe-S-cluster containining protein